MRIRITPQLYINSWLLKHTFLFEDGIIFKNPKDCNLWKDDGYEWTVYGKNITYLKFDGNNRVRLYQNGKQQKYAVFCYIPKNEDRFLSLVSYGQGIFSKPKHIWVPSYKDIMWILDSIFNSFLEYP